VCPMLTVSLGCPFFFGPSVFSNVYACYIVVQSVFKSQSHSGMDDLDRYWQVYFDPFGFLSSKYLHSLALQSLFDYERN
jgi:hypothetical protein